MVVEIDCGPWDTARAERRAAVASAQSAEEDARRTKVRAADEAVKLGRDRKAMAAKLADAVRAIDKLRDEAGVVVVRVELVF